MFLPLSYLNPPPPFEGANIIHTLYEGNGNDSHPSAQKQKYPAQDQGRYIGPRVRISRVGTGAVRITVRTIGRLRNTKIPRSGSGSGHRHCQEYVRITGQREKSFKCRARASNPTSAAKKERCRPTELARHNTNMESK